MATVETNSLTQTKYSVLLPFAKAFDYRPKSQNLVPTHGHTSWLQRHRLTPQITSYPSRSHIIPFVLDHLYSWPSHTWLSTWRCSGAQLTQGWMFVHVRLSTAVRCGKAMDRRGRCLTCETLAGGYHGTRRRGEDRRFAHGGRRKEFIPSKGHATEIKVG